MKNFALDIQANLYLSEDAHNRHRWLFCRFLSDGIFAKNLSTFNNFVFTLPLHSLDEIGCLLVKREDDCYEVAQGQYGTQNLTNVLRRNIRSCEDNSTPYEKFVASTENFYEGADVEKLKADADGRYKSVEEYSNAFERYYAAGGQDNYYGVFAVSPLLSAHSQVPRVLFCQDRLSIVGKVLCTWTFTAGGKNPLHMLRTAC